MKNLDHALLLDFIAHGGLPRPVDCSPLAVQLGARLLEADGETGAASLEFTADERFCQGNGVIQGGILTAMLDFAMAFAVLGRLPAGSTTATTSLNVHFMRPAPAGTYVAHGRVARLGGSMAFVGAELAGVHAGGTVASATATMPVRRA